MTCPKCRGRLILDQVGDASCLNCGWSPPDSIPPGLDLSTIHDRRRESAVGYSPGKRARPEPWEFA